jgi:hypothetical protein
MRIRLKNLRDGVARRIKAGGSPARTGGSPVPPRINQAIKAIREAIAQAQDAHQLLYISRTVIPKAMGITGEQRRELQLLVTEKFTALNIELSRREAMESL